MYRPAISAALFDYETDGIVPVEETGVQLKRILATGVAVKLSCAG